MATTYTFCSVVSATTTSIIIDATASNALLNSSSRPIVYYYSTSSTTPGDSTTITTSQTINRWCRLAVQTSENNAYEYTLKKLTTNKKYYIWVASPVPSGNTARNPITINKYSYDLSAGISIIPPTTACTAPTSVVVEWWGGSVVLQWYGAKPGTNNDITEYYYVINTSKSTSNAIKRGSISDLWDNSGNGTITFTKGTLSPGTYYAAIQTVGSLNNSLFDSDYAWSNAFTVLTHPSVAIGTTITKEQMDSLRSYKTWNPPYETVPSPNLVTKNTQINASDGNTYKSGLTAGATQITADWYNNA